MPMCNFFDKNELNFVGRYENYKKDISKVFKKKKLKFNFKNFSSAKFKQVNYLSFYDYKDNIKLVKEIYQKDLNRFDYNFKDFYAENEKKNKAKQISKFKQKKIKKKLFLNYIKNYLINKKFYFLNLKKVLYCK